MFFNKKIIKIDGMHCAHCAKSVEDGLKKINGIKKVKVNLEAGEAIVSYKGEFSIKEIEQCISDLGFQYVGIQE